MENQISNIKEIIIRDILIPSLLRLYEIDFDNIKNDVSERNICARLSLHIENNMRKYDFEHKTKLFQRYYADVEYNRMGNGNIKKYENSEHLPKKMVNDLLIQSRGPEPNFLVVEMKKEYNKQKVEEDKGRIISMVSPSSQDSHEQYVHDTLVGAFIEYSSRKVKIEIFEKVNEQGKKTRCIELEIHKNKNNKMENITMARNDKFT